ncbi:Protein FLX-like 1 [Camellia lanceoleosa]|uniref:Protein FLX-like 1 n=1 Tax=Camellia lanceoleosa TaxID=1840588 RepID=A0ACC0HVB0_9ERIC|nr:Protein FLX-like 1 [Camellia lanceoleosa]
MVNFLPIPSRDAIEYEKEAHASNLEQGEAMEKSKISMDYEIEKLCAELANAEKRARAAPAAAVAKTPSMLQGSEILK